MEKKLKDIQNNALIKIKNCTNAHELLKLKQLILGRNSELADLLKQVGKTNPKDRKLFGSLINDVKTTLNETFNKTLKKLNLQEQRQKMKNERIDVTLPGKQFILGHVHPITKVLNEIVQIFNFMGYSTADGPEIETEYYNFEALNIPKNHPARDTQDTFYLTKNNLLLRTQTSGVQIHVMEKQKPPLKIISPGRVFRSDSVDATHSPIFHQLEGLCIDRDVSMANLKHTLETFVKNFYGEHTKTRFRPHHFPFTEPSAEMDISCFACNGNGCALCKNEGFIEILGCGMVHSKVLKRCNINPEIYSGFAFGLGIERITMMRYKINDLRLFYENNLNFLHQF